MERLQTEEVYRQTAIFRLCHSGPASEVGGLCSLGDVEGGPTFLLPSDKCPGPWRQKKKQTKDTD